MKRIFVFVIVILIFYLCLFESRKFYCIDESHCVTVWGRYVIPRKYYGIINPTDNYVKVSLSVTDLDLIWYDNSKRILVNCSQEFSIFNNDNSKLRIEDYRFREKFYDSVLTHVEKNYCVYNDSVVEIAINMKEGYSPSLK